MFAIILYDQIDPYVGQQRKIAHQHDGGGMVVRVTIPCHAKGGA